EVAGDGVFGFAVFGIDGEVGGCDLLAEGLDHAGGTADRVLVEVEAEFAGASRGGRVVWGHRDDGGPGFDEGGHLRALTSTLRAWASRPSARARVVMAGASFASAGSLNSCTLITFR